MNTSTRAILDRGIAVLARLRLPISIMATTLLLFTCIGEGNLSPLFFTLFLWGFGRLILRLSLGLDRRQDFVVIFDLLFWLSVLLTCGIYHYYLSVYRVPYESGGTDDERYERMANALLGMGTVNIQELQDEVAQGQGGSWNPNANYVIIVAGVHAFIRWIGLVPHTLNPRLFNALALGMGGVVVGSIALRCGVDRLHARWSGLFWGLLPGVWFCSAHIYRDVLVGFGIAAVVLATLMLFLPDEEEAHERQVAGPIALAVVGALVSTTMREGLPLALLGVCVLVVVAARGWWKSFLVALGLAFVAALVLGNGIAVITQSLTRAQEVYEHYSLLRRGQGAEGGLGTSIYALPWYVSLVLRLAYVSVTPLPFPADTITENFRRFGTVIWFASLPFLVGGFWKAVGGSVNAGQRNLKGIALAFLCFYVLVAWLTMQDRHLTMYVPFGAVILARAVQERPGSLGPPVFAMALTGLGMVVLYSLIQVVH